MQHIETSHPTTTATTDLAANATFAGLADARRAARAEERANDARAKAEQEQDRRNDAEQRWHGHIYHRLSPALRDALDIRISTEEDTSDRWHYVTTGHFTSPVTGSACTLTVRSVYGDLFPELKTATGFTATLPERMYDPTPYQPGALDAPLLDALDDEQGHIAKLQEEARAKLNQTAAEQAEEEEAAATNKVPFYSLVTDASHAGEGILHTRSRVHLCYETPETGEYGERSQTVTSVILDWTPQWLLVQTGEKGSQRLIPRERVCYLTPASPSSKLGW